MSVTHGLNRARPKLKDRGGRRQALLIADRLKKYFPITGGLLNRTIG
jgi:hypothetical protein